MHKDNLFNSLNEIPREHVLEYVAKYFNKELELYDRLYLAVDTDGEVYVFSEEPKTQEGWEEEFVWDADDAENISLGYIKKVEFFEMRIMVISNEDLYHYHNSMRVDDDE